jgi:hypothetical protein
MKGCTVACASVSVIAEQTLVMNAEDAGPTVGTAASPASLVAASDDTTADAGAAEVVAALAVGDGVAVGVVFA